MLTLLGLGLVQAATARALVEIDAGRRIGPLHAYGLALDSIGPLLGALAIAVSVISVLASSVFLLPVAIWLTIRWALVAQTASSRTSRPRGRFGAAAASCGWRG